MAENIKLAEFDIDIDAVIKSAAQLKQSIDAIKQAQKENTLETEEQNEAWVENDAKLKALNKEYQQHIKVINESITATSDAANRQELMNAVLSQEVTTIAEAREQNKLLNKLRNEANATTKEGQDEITRLNKALDANNEFIKDNVDALSQQKINVGNYTESVREAFSVNALLTGGLTGLRTALSTAATGFLSMTKAALAFLATPIGAVIGALGLALGLVVNAFTSTQEGMDKVTAVTRPLIAVFEVLMGVVQDIGLLLIEAFENPKETLTELYDYIKDKVIKQFEALSNVVMGLLTFDSDRIKQGLDQVGNNIKETWGEIGGVVDKFNDKVMEGIRLGQELDRITKDYEQTQIRNAELVPQLNAALKEQNKIAEDQTKTQVQREQAAINSIALAKEINTLKKEELSLELAILENQASRNDTSREELLKIAELKGKIADVDAQTLELETTQQNKLNSIRKEAEAQRQKALDEHIKKQKELLDLFIAEQGERARTLQEELTLEETLSAKRKAILEEELKAKKISQEAYKTALIEIDQDLAKRRAEIAVDNAMREIEANRMSIERQREDKLFLSQELANQRKLENETILLQEQELARLRLQQGLINQQEFDDAIRELSEINRIANREIDIEREAIEKEERAALRALEFEEDLARLLEEGATRFEIQQAQNDENRLLELQKLEEQRTQGLLSEELYAKKQLAINTKYKKLEEQLNRQVEQNKIDVTETALNHLAAILGRESAAGKAIAVAQATMDTYKSAVAAYAAGSSLPGPAGVVMGPVAAGLAVGAGVANVKKILSTKVPGASGGGGSVPTSGTIGTATTDLRSLASNESNLTSVAASGNATVQQQITDNANNSGLTDRVANAVEVAAERGTRKGSEEGLTNLSDNRNIRELSTN